MRLHTLFLAATLVSAATPVTAGPISALIAFGDSLSDTGNLTLMAQSTPFAGVPIAPYAPGRASNGPLAIDYVASSLGLPLLPALAGGTNYAVIGAATGDVPLPLGGTADNTIEVTLGTSLPLDTGLVSQVGAYLSAQVPLGPIDPDALFFLWSGANDFFLNDQAPATVIPTAVGRIVGAVDALYLGGARRFLIPNLPDLSLTPDGSPALQGQTMQFNTLLAQQLATRQTLPGMQLVHFDTFAAFNAIIADAAALGFSNVEDECYTGGPLGFGGGISCASPSSFVFWDNAHPSAATNRLIGAQLAAAVPAAVPEPATVLLGSLGLAAVACRRRRRPPT